MANNSTDLGQSKYDFKYRTFPDDLGADYVGHYIVININVPTTRFAVGPKSAAGNYTNLFTELNSMSKVDKLRYLDSIPSDKESGLNFKNIKEGLQNFFNSVIDTGGPNRALLSLPRQTKRIAESIALFMPEGLSFTDQNDYQPIDMSAFGGAFISGAASAAAGAVGKAAAAGEIIDSIGRGIGTVAAVMGSPINPGVEVIFTTKRLRVFTLDFLMAPRNEKESLNLKAIIKTLRFHAAPEIDTRTLGATWIPPADFDITFFKHGVENFNIQRINTCVLERVDVIYDPVGQYSTFTNGHPVSVRMTLHFQEVEPVHKLRILQGF